MMDKNIEIGETLIGACVILVIIIIVIIAVLVRKKLTTLKT